MQDTWIMIIICTVIAMFACVLVFVIAIYVREYWKFQEVPHERPKPIMATMKALCSCGYSAAEEADEAEEHYRRLYHQFRGSGPFCGFYDVLEPRVLILDRELVKQILIKDFSNFNDHGVYSNPKHDPLSGDLYSRFGKAWKEMRYRLEPVFMLEQMGNLYTQTYADSDQLLQTITSVLHQQQATQQLHNHESETFIAILDVQQHLRRFVLSTIARSVFGLYTAQLQEKYPMDEFEAMTQLMLTTHRHGSCLTHMCQSQPTLSRHLGLAITNKKAEAYFRNLIADVVEQRESGNEGVLPQDYMQLLFELMTTELSTHESEREGDARSNLKEHLLGEMAAHAFTFVKMGYESLAHTLTMTLYELATHPEVQSRAREEVRLILAKHNNEWNNDCVHEMGYLGQIIAETIRLHPVHPYLVRRTLHDYRLSDYTKYVIRKNMLVIIPIDAMHHDPVYYPEPDMFNPDRFAPEISKQRDQCTWLGYGAGPRSCIGFFFSQLVMRIVLGRLLTHYIFKVPQQLLVIRYEDGVNLQVETLTGADKRQTTPPKTANVESDTESCESKTMI